MHRYLLNISYIGTNFRGIQKTRNKLNPGYLDASTIQGSIELALRTFRPVNEIETVLSSRTDAGVHALHSTVHVDLQRSSKEPYDTTTLTGVLNRTLAKQNLQIRVLSSYRVPDTFHCRYNATGRTYLYRLAVAKPVNGESNDSPNLGNRTYESFIPVEELDRCFFLQNSNFDVERCRSAARLFVGRHDFRTFMNTSHDQHSSSTRPMFTVRRIEEINIRPGRSVAIGLNAVQAEQLYNYWDVEIKGKSFLYKQVRRIVGTLIAAATGRIDEKCIYQMLTIPSKHTWVSNIALSPACGLYLRQVHYNEQDFVFNQAEPSK